MKTRPFLALLFFLLAAGTATARHLLTDPMGHSRKPDVPIQILNCESRRTCPGGSNPCTALVDHDANPITAPIAVNLYEGIQRPGLICGMMLFDH